MSQDYTESYAKVPEVTLVFWLMKIVATTLGETGGDALSMSLGVGYLVSTAIFAILFCGALFIQMKAQTFHPIIYWVTIVATTTVGTTLADYVDRSVGLGYTGGALILLTCVCASLGLWHYTLGSIAINTVTSRKQEVFYWTTIMFSQTLGTALGDWTADSTGLGYGFSALVFGAILSLLALLYYRTTISRTLLFWAAFILTRPLGAVLGDLLDKPITHGGMALSRYTATFLLIIFLALCIKFFTHKPATAYH